MHLIKKAAPTVKPILTSNTPSIRGTITDESTGEVIPMANVVVKSGHTIVQGGSKQILMETISLALFLLGRIILKFLI